MADNFKIVVFTPPAPVDNEAQKIERLLGAGANIVSLRKPGIGVRYIESVLKQLRPELRHRIRLHDNPELARAFGTGFQLNSRTPQVTDIDHSSMSKSCHTINEVLETNGVDYVTLSPIYDSISKAGYKSQFDLSSLDLSSVDVSVVAMGGMTLDRIPLIRAAGFAGAAFLGDVWRDTDSFNRFVRYLTMRNSRLQYVTDGDSPDDTVNLALAALKGGCRWVQIRMKNDSHEAVADVMTELVPKFTALGATLIVDDHVDIAATTEGVAGVHLGQTDMPPSEARKVLPADKVIGFTVNSAIQLRAAAQQYRHSIDYLGIGPLRFTSTKKKLATPLGLDGLEDIRLLMTNIGFIPPAVVIGGVIDTDYKPLAQIGYGGVAVSGAIGHAANPAASAHLLTTTAADLFGHSIEDDYINFVQQIKI
ncbi:MAG: thiamine phosphate synthase [Bacteroides sp.]|nr:thiamine phosphate synthase [Bacteroides sp.]